MHAPSVALISESANGITLYWQVFAYQYWISNFSMCIELLVDTIYQHHCT